MPRLSRRTILLVGFCIGLALWLVPAQFMGVSEPWDGNSPAYPLALLVGGLLLGFLGPSRPGAAVTGLFLGQLTVMLYRVVATPESGESSKLWLVGAVMLAGYTSVASGIGAMIGSLLRRRLHPETPVERRVSDRRA